MLFLVGTHVEVWATPQLCGRPQGPLSHIRKEMGLANQEPWKFLPPSTSRATPATAVPAALGAEDPAEP